MQLAVCDRRSGHDRAAPRSFACRAYRVAGCLRRVQSDRLPHDLANQLGDVHLDMELDDVGKRVHLDVATRDELASLSPLEAQDR